MTGESSFLSYRRFKFKRPGGSLSLKKPQPLGTFALTTEESKPNSSLGSRISRSDGLEDGEDVVFVSESHGNTRSKTGSSCVMIDDNSKPMKV